MRNVQRETIIGVFLTPSHTSTLQGAGGLWFRHHGQYPMLQRTCFHGNPQTDCSPLHQQATSCFNVKRQLAGINLRVVEITPSLLPPLPKQIQLRIFFCFFKLQFSLFMSASPIRPQRCHSQRHNSPVVSENFQPFQVILLLEQYEAATRKSLTNEKAIPFHSGKELRRRGGGVSHQLLKRNGSLG